MATSGLALGYSPMGAYGTCLRLPAVFRQAEAAAQQRATRACRTPRSLERSEQDVINVLEMVLNEYPVDRASTFLTGHSMGSGGTWYLGAKYADYWAAIAPMSGPFVEESDLPVGPHPQNAHFHDRGYGSDSFACREPRDARVDESKRIQHRVHGSGRESPGGWCLWCCPRSLTSSTAIEEQILSEGKQVKNDRRTFLLTAAAAAVSAPRFAAGQTSAKLLVPDKTWDCRMPGGIPNPESGTLIFEVQMKLDRLANLGKTPYGNRRVAVGLEGMVAGTEAFGHCHDGSFGLRTDSFQRGHRGRGYLRFQNGGRKVHLFAQCRCRSRCQRHPRCDGF